MGYTFDNVHYPKITGLLSDMTCVSKVVQDHSQVRRLARWSRKARHVVHSLLWFIPAKGRGTWPRAWGSQAQTPCGVTQDTRDSSGAELWWRVWSIVCQGSSLETRCPVFMGASHVCIPCPARTRVQIPRGEADIHREPHCFHKQFRRRETFLSGNGGNPLEIHIPGSTPKASPAIRPF